MVFQLETVSTVNFCDQWLETLPLLKVERNDPVYCEWTICLEGPEEGDNEFSDISIVLSSSPSKREAPHACVRGGGNDLRILSLLPSSHTP